MGESQTTKVVAARDHMAGAVTPGVKTKKPVAAPDTPPPSPLDRKALRDDTSVKREELAEAKKEGNFVKTLMARLGLLTTGLNELFPMRVWNLYTRRRGPLMAAGNAYLMFFSVGAMLVAGFAIFGLVVAGNPMLRDAVIKIVAESTPGLIDTGDGKGLAKPEQLLSPNGSGLALVISLAALLVTAMGWINGLREGIRGVLGLSADRTNAVVSKLRDAATLILLAVTLVVTSGLGVLSSAAVGGLGESLGWGSALSGAATRFGSVGIMFVLDVTVAIIMFSLAAHVKLPRKALLWAAIFSGAGATILRFFSANLVGGVTRNPVLAPFAVILGLFVWFYLLSQVYLIAAAIAAILAADTKTDKADVVPSVAPEGAEDASDGVVKASEADGTGKRRVSFGAAAGATAAGLAAGVAMGAIRRNKTNKN